ncbi:MAG: response regulator transcription factor [Erysipelotrichaceae bacterium]
MRILIVEDERSLRTILVERLKKAGYSVDSCDNGTDGKDYIEGTQYDCVLLDIMIPKLDGLSLLRILREKDNKTVVMMLTAKDSVEDRVKGLDLGADDYLIKPFAFDELLARIRMLTRRQFNNVSSVLSIADLSLDTVSKIVKRSGKIIDLSSKEFALLEYFMQNKERVLSREQIEQHIWNYDYESGSNVIDVYIRFLRKKIDDDYDVKLIHTMRGYGYVMKVSL